MRNRIFNECCLQTMSRMEDESVDMVLTSPPYDDLRTYHGFSFEFEETAKELSRILKPGRVIVWISSDATKNGSETGTSFRQALYFMEIGLNLHDTMIYRKTNYPPIHKGRYGQSFEYMFIFSKGRPKVFNPIMDKTATAGSVIRQSLYRRDSDFPERKSETVVAEEKIKSNVWDVSPRYGVRGHPAQFPEKLAAAHIISWSNPEDLIYDPFMGSGTTGRVALMYGRDYLGSEVSPKYCELAEERIRYERELQDFWNKHGIVPRRHRRSEWVVPVG